MANAAGDDAGSDISADAAPSSSTANASVIGGFYAPDTLTSASLRSYDRPESIVKLVKQANLAYRQGASNKVYEVDLCRVGDDQYVVNFRYGRHGGKLREGSKTPMPVSRAVAEREFDKLVAAKVKKGYHEQGESPEAPEPPQPQASGHPQPAYRPGQPLGPRERAILQRLDAGDRAPRRAWKLERAIWRAGELAIPDAAPHLIGLWRKAKKNQLLRRYSIVWSLGRCAPQGSQEVIAVLESIVDGVDGGFGGGFGGADGEAECTRRMALEGLRRLYFYDEGRRAEFINGHIDKLPRGRSDLADLARSGPADAFRTALHQMLEGDSDSRKAAQRALETCYLIDNEHVRPGLLHVLRHKPLGKNYFLRMRHIFKAAEFRRDGEVFGILAYRFEKTPGHHLSRYARRKAGEPFSRDTRLYLRRRVWRTLRQLGLDDSEDFVKMAAGVLVPFGDDDAGEPMTRRYYRWRRPDIIIKWDRFSNYWAFNHLLYGNSARYYADQNSKAWRCTDAYTPGQPGPEGRREEAFPASWDRMPTGLLYLLDESECEPVHEFAAKALRSNTAFVAELDASAAIMLLGRPYPITAALGFTVAERLYNPLALDAADTELLAAVAECVLAPARKRARTWIDQNRSRLSQDTQLMASLASSAYRDNRKYARNLLRAAVLSEETAQALVGRLIAVISQLGAEEDKRIASISSTLMSCFADALSRVGIALIRDLLDHPAAAAQELAGELLLNHADLARRVPDELLLHLLDSPHENARAIGAKLFAQLPDSALIEHRQLLFLLAIHELADLRGNIRPVIARLALSNASFAGDMARELAGALMKKQAKGVHSSLLSLLREDLRDHLHHIDKDTIWQLLHHKHPQAQELGGVLLAAQLGPDDLSVAEIVKLASHEILSIRQGAWAMCEKAIDRIKRAMPTAVRLLDAKWQDSRDFAFGFFRDQLSQRELTPEILVAICDSIRADVQQFGREMITRYFREEDGHTYLLRLSEHPDEGLQLFATNYLERYASGEPARISALEPYFLRVLSGVNKGRIAKQRSIAFLLREALADEASAAVAARIFTRQSATLAIGDKAAMIEAMVQMARAYPGIRLPITIKAPPSKQRNSGGGARGGV